MSGKQRGYILILTMTVISVLMIFGIAFMNFYLGEKALATNSEIRATAEEASEAGINAAVEMLKENYGIWGSKPGDGFANVALPVTGATYSMTFQQGTAPYSTYNYGNTVSVNTGWPGNRMIPAGAVHLVSVGRFQNMDEISEAIVTLKPNSLFSSASVQKQTINITGSMLTDSYNSDNGSYNVNGNIGNKGNLQTDIGSNGAVNIGGNSTVNGTITYTGPKNPNAISVKGNSATFIQPGLNTLQPIIFPVPTPPPGSPSITIDSKKGFDFTKGNTLPRDSGGNLIPGTYSFVTSGISMNGGSVILPDPSTGVKINLYADGNINITGNPMINGFVTTTQGSGKNKVTVTKPESGIPGNLIVYGTNNTTSVIFDVAGTPDLYWVLYAPNADITMKGNMSIYGSIISKTLTVQGNASIHYDTALDKIPDGSPRMDCVYKSRW